MKINKVVIATLISAVASSAFAADDFNTVVEASHSNRKETSLKLNQSFWGVDASLERVFRDGLGKELNIEVGYPAEIKPGFSITPQVEFTHPDGYVKDSVKPFDLGNTWKFGIQTDLEITSRWNVMFRYRFETAKHGGFTDYDFGGFKDSSGDIRQNTHRLELGTGYEIVDDLELSVKYIGRIYRFDEKNSDNEIKGHNGDWEFKAAYSIGDFTPYAQYTIKNSDHLKSDMGRLNLANENEFKVGLSYSF
ncbi:hypothetical protein C942_03605 [Photobacterium marinum]|uniref:Outer membrane protein beta-barrel domain-containing protein n=1 Tax=Photobacterium marinum TaxID=1056511 RepID=L8J5W1_9GAMM|nr:oligogalacturonate-specific porin KdgM family protein [Photobacterium marinum]ELR63588.1 hypothetical protein C942_03605 [Photobacterium marinum]